MMEMRLFWELLCLGYFSGICGVKLKIPKNVTMGSDVKLECNFDELSRKNLYSVKWYKGKNEIFGYDATSNPPYKFKNMEGIMIDTKSSESFLILRNVSLLTSGIFVCEVTLEKSFYADSDNDELRVLYIPTEAPFITGGQDTYKPGDWVDVECWSHKSKPAASLSWRINNDKAPENDLIEYVPVVHDDGLETARLGLKFLVRNSHFKNGKIKLKCTSSISEIYWRQQETTKYDFREAAAMQSRNSNKEDDGMNSKGHFLTANANICLVVLVIASGIML